MCVLTDHAVLRYLERVWGIDVPGCRAEMIAAGAAVDVAAKFGCGTVKMGNGARLRLVGDTVVTVVPKRGR
jgi:hypothetical protein